MLTCAIHKDLDKLLVIIKNLISDFKSNEIVRILSCCAKMQFVRPKIIRNLCLSIKRDELNSKDCAELFFSFGKLQRMHIGSLKYSTEYLGFSKLDYKNGMPLFNDQEIFLNDILHKMNISKSYSEMNHIEISNMIYGIGQVCINQSNNKYYVHHINKLILKIINDNTIKMYSPISLSIMIYSMGQLNIQNEYIIKTILKTIIEKYEMSEFALEGLSTMIYGLGQIEWEYDEFVELLINEIIKKERLYRLSAWDLSSILYGISRIKHINKSEKIEIIIKEMFRTRRLASFTEQGITLLLYSLSQIDVNNLNIYKMTLNEILKIDRMSELTFKGICNVISSLDRIYKRNKIEFEKERKMFANLLENEIKFKFNQINLTEKDIVSLLYGLSIIPNDYIKKDEKIKLINDLSLKIINNQQFFTKINYYEITVLCSSISNEIEYFKDIWTYIIDYLKYENIFKNMNSHLLSCLFLAISKYIRFEKHIDYSDIITILYNELIYHHKKIHLLADSDINQLICGIDNIFCQDKYRNCINLNELNDLFSEIINKEKYKKFSSYKLISIITKMPKSNKYFNAHEFNDFALKELSEEERLQKLDINSICYYLYYSAKRKFNDGEFVNKLIYILKENSKVIEMNCNQISMIIQSLGILNIDDKDLINSILKECIKEKRIKQYSGKNIVLIFHGLSKLKAKNTLLLHFLCQELLSDNHKKILELDYELISIMLFSLAKLQYKNKDCIFLLIKRLKEFDIDKTTILSAINILNAFSKLDIIDQSLIENYSNYIIKRNYDERMNCKSIMSFLYSIGRLGIYNQTTIKFLENFISERDEKNINTNIIPPLFYAYTRLRLNQYNDFSSKLLILLNNCNVSHFNASHYGTILCNLNSLTLSHESFKIINKILICLCHKIDQGLFEINEMTSFVIGIGKLLEKYQQISSGYLILTLICNKKVLKKINERQLISIIHALSYSFKFGKYLMMDCLSILNDKGYKNCTNKELIRLLDSLVIFKDIFKDDNFKNLLKELSKMNRFINYSKDDISKLNNFNNLK